MVSPAQTKQSKEIQRRTGRTFHVATRFLPEHTREETYVLYAFFRITDEIVDDPDPMPKADQRASLERIRRAALGLQSTTDPVLDAFSTIRSNAAIPDHEINEFIDAMLADVDATPYETFEDLEQYLRGSAVAVAYMMLEIMEPPEKSTARPHARSLGEAFQLTNFLRDVSEDIDEYGRMYIPIASLERHGLDASVIERGEFSPAFRRVIEDELERTEERYRHGVAGIRYLPDDCQFPVTLASVLYAEHHAKIRELGCDVLTNRPTLGYLDYVRLIVKTGWYWHLSQDPEEVFHRASAVSPDPDHTAHHIQGSAPSVREMLSRCRFLPRLFSWRN